MARVPCWGRLSRRISSWTTNLVVTGIVLVALLAFGRQRFGKPQPSPAAR